MDTRDLLCSYVISNDTDKSLDIINKHYLNFHNNGNVWDTATTLAYKAIDNNNIDILSALILIIHNNTDYTEDNFDDCVELLEHAIRLSDINLIKIIDYIIHFWLPNMNVSYESHVDHMLSGALALILSAENIDISIFKYIIDSGVSVTSTNILGCVRCNRVDVLEELLKSNNITISEDVNLNHFFTQAVHDCSIRGQVILILNFSKDKINSYFYNELLDQARSQFSVDNEEDI